MSMRVVAIAGLSVVALAIGMEVWWELGADRAPDAPVATATPAPAPVAPTTPVSQSPSVTTQAASTTASPSAPERAPPPATESVPPAPTPIPAAPKPAPGPGMPLPPMPPRIASGADYERCLAMVASDPTGANAFAEAWEATGGGDGARHCHAAAQISLGKMAAGAEMLEKLARSSAAPALVRAFIYGQATQAWLLAGDAQRAYASATLAVVLAPDDVDLLVDRSIAAATMERYLDSIEDLNAALDRDPKRADALVFRAAAWRHDGQLGLAQDDIDRALALEPENPEALLERGILRQRKGDLAGARADWEAVLAVAPDGATADMAQQNLSLLDVGPGRR